MKKSYEKTIKDIVIGKGISGKTKPKKAEHNQAKIDRENSAKARKSMKKSEYKTKRVT